MSNYLKLKKQLKNSTVEALCIDQVKYELLGYQAFYKDGFNKFYTNLKDIEDNIVSNPLVDIKQVGTPRQKKIQSLYSDVKEIFSINRNFNK